jgi:LPS export ABC transporter protein LptC
VLKSASVTYLPSRSQGTFSDNHLVFYKGRATRLEVSAPSAVLNLKNYDVTLRGGVRAINSNGDALDADQIQYDGRRHQLLASGNVVAVDANGTKITGDRAIADLDLQVVRIFGHINMTGQGH